jgi:hypothetical protein
MTTEASPIHLIGDSGSHFFGYENDELINRRWTEGSDGSGFLCSHNHTTGQFLALYYSKKRTMQMSLKDDQSGVVLVTERSENDVIDYQINDIEMFKNFVLKGLTGRL